MLCLGVCAETELLFKNPHGQYANHDIHDVMEGATRYTGHSFIVSKFGWPVGNF
jgi:hypothetical protein